MKNNNSCRKNLIVRFTYLLLIFIIVTSGCVSWFLGGGALVDSDYQPLVIIEYEAEGTVPRGATYYLVKTAEGEAIFERVMDGSGVLFQTRWEDDKGQHFAGWVISSYGFEFVVPLDRTKPAEKYMYPYGSYTIETINGITRLVSNTPSEPVATLNPK